MALRSVVIVLLAAMLLSAAISVAWRNYAIASDSYGLIMLASTEFERSWNPFHRDGWILAPEAAAWILLNTRFHVERCAPLSVSTHQCEMSHAAWVLRFLSDDLSNEVRVGEMLDLVLSRGADPNKVYEGLTPAHEAVMYRTPNMLRKLIEAGADPLVSVDRTDQPYDGYNVLQYAEHLYGETSPTLVKEFRSTVTGALESNSALQPASRPVTRPADATRAPGRLAAELGR